MTFQTFKRFVLMSVFFMTTSVVIYAQQSTMQGLIGQSLAKLQQPTSESILNCIAEMKLYEKNGKYYVSENVAPEVYALRKETKDLADASVADAKDLKGVAANMNGAFEIEADVTPDANGIAGIEISNNKRERTQIYFDMKQDKVVMDRTESGLTDFGKQAVPHDIELAWDKQRAAEGKEPARITNSINYKNDFALATWAPLSLCEDGKKTYHVDIFVDKSSVELFVDGGRIAMTNLVFPVAPYENVKLYTQGGKAEFKNMKVHKLGL
jgi:fructan beta-fructosidase